MTYKKTIWKDLPSKETPVDAKSLNNIEDGIAKATDGVANASGRVNTNKDNIQINKDGIKSNVTEIRLVNTKVNTNTDNIKSNLTEIGLVDKKVNTNTVNIKSLDNQQFKIKNEIVNGDFSDGLGGWTTASKVVNNELELITDIRTTAFAQPAVDIKVGDVHYYSMNVRVMSKMSLGPLHYIGLRTRTGGSGNLVIDTKDYSIGESVFLSEIKKGEEGHTVFQAIIYDAELVAQVNIINTTVINLTETFGKGNEPTKEQMDKLIEITGWFDGNKSLTTKELLDYTLDLDTRKANRKQEEWITPTLMNGVENYSPAYEAVGYYKDDFGMVHLRGLFKGGVSRQSIFELPIVYRPRLNIMVSVGINTGATIVIQIGTDGRLTTTSALPLWTTLNNVSFRAGGN